MVTAAVAEAEEEEPPSGKEGNEGIKAATDDQRLAEAVVGGGGGCGIVLAVSPLSFRFFISGVAVSDTTTPGGTTGNGDGTGKGFSHFSKNLITGISETIVV